MLINAMTEEIEFFVFKNYSLLQRGLLHHALLKRSTEEENVEKMRGKRERKLKKVEKD